MVPISSRITRLNEWHESDHEHTRPTLIKHDHQPEDFCSLRLHSFVVLYLRLTTTKINNFRSLVSRVAVTDTYKEIAHLSKSLHFSSRCLPGILSSYVSFYHELHEWTNGTNLFWFSIREIRSFVTFVISKHLIPHHHNPSTRQLQRELPESHSFSTVPEKVWIP